MKRCLAIIAILAWPMLTASASPELAADWGRRAAGLYDVTVAMREGAPGRDSYREELARFSVASSRLAGWIDDESGPGDLACIFRGMAQEAETQLHALEAGDVAEALERLTLMFSDAEMVSAAAIRAMRRDHAPARDDAGSDAAAATCPSRPLGQSQYFTEQP